MAVEIIYKPTMIAGYNSLESLAELKGYKNRLQSFSAAYVIYWNHDEDGNKFYNCEERT